MSRIYSVSIKHLAGILFFLAALSVAAQEPPSPEMPFMQEESVAETTPVLGAETPSVEFPPETPSLPEETEQVDLEYEEPPGENEDFTAPPVTLPEAREPLLRRIGSALFQYLSGPAVTRRREPLRYFDWELFSMNVDVANNLIGASDILRETIKINGTELAARADGAGVKLNTEVLFRNALDFNRNSGGFGFFVTMDGSVKLDVSEALLSLFAYGNAGNTQVSGSLSVSGAVFSDIGFHRYFDVDKWRFDIRPAWFIPLLYVPLSDVSFTFETEDSVTIGTFGTVTAYLPVNLDSGSYMLNTAGGLDFSVAAEYALFPIIDVGLAITHIPFMPARLSSKVRASIDESILDNVSIIDILQDPGSLSINFSPDYTLSSAEAYVIRPFSMDTWFLYRPFRTDLLGIKPNIGFTTSTPSGLLYFNMGLELELNVQRVLFLSVRSGREEGVWHHGVGLGINLRVVQVNCEAALASQDYLAAWKGRGLSVGVGLHVGY
jgi:hypothetical protein